MKNLLRSFQECDVRYLLADGFSHHKSTGLKFTKEVDFWLKPSLDNARRVFRALKIFGTPMHGIAPEKLATAETQFTLQCRPYQLEFYTHIPHLVFEKSWEARESYKEGSIFIPLLNKADLLIARSSLTRPPDDHD